MAGNAVKSVASAVTGELTGRVFSGLIQRYGKHSATSEKLQRLEMLLIKIHSAVEASEKSTIDNSWLLRWRDKLKEAASQGDEVLASFSQQAKDAQDTSKVNSNQKQGEAASSCAAAPAKDVGLLSFTGNSVTNMVQGICNAGKVLFLSADNNMERLNMTLESLGKLSPDIGEFIRLLHLEAIPKVHQAAYGTTLSTNVHGPTEKVEETRENKRMKYSTTHSNPSSPEEEDLYSSEYDYESVSSSDHEYEEYDSKVLQKDQQFTLLHDRLEAAFGEICKAVDLVDTHDLEDLEWLAYWAGILREAKEQGCDVLSSTGAPKTVSTKDKEEPSIESDQEEDELGTFVHRLEGLARDVEYFSKLVYLCPMR